jgi:hypothetical protein
VLVWVEPMVISERILATAIGTIGLTWAIIRCLSLRLKLAQQKCERDPKNIVAK